VARRYLSCRLKIDYRPLFTVTAYYPSTSMRLAIHAASKEDALLQAIKKTTTRAQIIPIRYEVAPHPTGTIGL
jgi:hypothetical protein